MGLKLTNEVQAGIPGTKDITKTDCVCIPTREASTRNQGCCAFTPQETVDET